MNRHLWAGLFTLPLLLASGPSARANPPYPVVPPPGCNGAVAVPGVGLPCAFAGCGGFCMNLFGRIHFHGPLVNYGPYQGYYPFEPYGPWTANLQYNPPPAPCKNCGNDRGWRLYSLLTLNNVRDRIHPLKHKCGKGGWSDCSSGGCDAHTISAAPGASSVTIPPVPATAVAVGR